PVNVTSGPAIVMGSAQSTATNAVNAVSSTLSGFGFGHKKTNVPAVEAVATGARVVLPPGTQLQFVLGASPAMAAGPAPSTASSYPTPGMPNTPGVNHPMPGMHPAPNVPHPNVAPSNSASQPSMGTLTAKITETLLGPKTTVYVVSPDGGHYAA